MLKSFYVKNFKSWKNETMIDMTAESISEHPYDVIQTKRGKYLKNLVIYGANASGKSNLIDALDFVYQKVMEIYNERDWNKNIPAEIRNNPLSTFLSFQRPKCASYANKVSASEFEITFIDNDDEYSFGFEMKQGHIINEWLDRNGKVVYDRAKQELTKINEYRFIFVKTPDDQLYISYIIAYSKIDSESVLDSLTRFFLTMGVFKDFEKLDPLIINAVMTNLFKSNRKSFDMMNEFFEIIDFGILRMEYDEPRKAICFLHQGQNEIFKMYLSDESLGTRKMLMVLIGVLMRLESGGLIIADEFTSSLHPLLSKLILDMISSESYNTGNAQMIFTTHDIFLLRKEQLRRDEIAFTYKNSAGESAIVKLYDIKVSEESRIRKDATYWKDYLRGAYEGSPSINYELFVSEKVSFYGKKTGKKG